MIDIREGVINKTLSLPWLYCQTDYVLVSVLHTQTHTLTHTQTHTLTHTQTHTSPPPLKALFGRLKD